MAKLELTVPTTEALSAIDAAILRGELLLLLQATNQEQFDSLVSAYRGWRTSTYLFLDSICETDALSTSFGTSRQHPSYPLGTITQVLASHRQFANARLANLRGIRDGIASLPAQRDADIPTPTVPENSVRVFIVHGRAGREHEVARFIESKGLIPVILGERPHLGSTTLIEKLERETSNLAFAVVLATGDDLGKLAGSNDDLTPRVRQNVLAEMGYLLAKVGRNRVTVLFEEGVDWPSDFKGAGYYPFDVLGAWKHSLATELGEAIPNLRVDDSA